jgi:hypothetical protein
MWGGGVFSKLLISEKSQDDSVRKSLEKREVSEAGKCLNSTLTEVHTTKEAPPPLTTPEWCGFAHNVGSYPPVPVLI